MRRWRGALLLAGAAGLAACDDGPDPEAVARGARLFETGCAACHALDEPRIGPPLAGVVGREAGSVEGFGYSAALAGHGRTWTEESLAAFLRDPEGTLPGGNMVITPLGPKEASDVVAYLASES
jgi:cytochrome c2